ncbi:ABC transporter permease [Saccharothrix longispora]|uniref:ABC transporter permease n=1 Tax=Saccharothrix longispora TaxID=33920 RepID=UPI0028FD9386|nr:ABC transporter permease [Saccharothrix longispora]MDU0289183.1 ABC transporter permease [Saccharothrix longispora]
MTHTATSPPGTTSPLGTITALGVAELKLLLRNRTAATLAFLLPLAGGVYFALMLPGDGGWAAAITFQLLFTLGFTVYLTATTALTARRQDLYLKRLRTGAASDAVVLTGLLLPVVLLAVAQTALLLGISFAAGAPWPERPGLFLLAVGGGAAMSCVAGVLTSGVTSTAEMAQLTTGPYFIALVFGSMVATAGEVDDWVAFVPGGAIGLLVRAAWGGPATQVTLALLSLALWTAAAYAASTRLFRWDPRT